MEGPVGSTAEWWESMISTSAILDPPPPSLKNSLYIYVQTSNILKCKNMQIFLSFEVSITQKMFAQERCHVKFFKTDPETLLVQNSEASSNYFRVYLLSLKP